MGVKDKGASSAAQGMRNPLLNRLHCRKRIDPNLAHPNLAATHALPPCRCSSWRRSWAGCNSTPANTSQAHHNLPPHPAPTPSPSLLQSLQELEAQLGATTGKYGTLAKSYDEAVHKANLARQARERAHADVERKEEEICALEVRVAGGGLAWVRVGALVAPCCWLGSSGVGCKGEEICALEVGGLACCWL